MLYEQFSKPEGWTGKLAGLFMSKENEVLNDWTLSFLSIEKKDRVLEIGFGPGAALQKVAEYQGVTLYGADPSEVMVESAAKRLVRYTQPEQICLIHGEASCLHSFHQPLDKIYAINNVTYWEEPVTTLRHLKSLLRKGGKIALTLRPHEKGATDETSEVLGGQLTALLQEAGFKNTEVFLKPATPNAAVCAVGMNQ